MSDRIWKGYLAGEVHSEWRQELMAAAENAGRPIEFYTPVVDHDASDNCGVRILGDETAKFWKDHKAANMNAIRTRTLITEANVVVVRFGDKYKEWNAAFDAGYAAALGTPLIIQHNPDHTHALKEVDAAAQAVGERMDQLLATLRYVTTGQLVD